jgi:DNA-binding MarR family transcriptional regulator
MQSSAPIAPQEYAAIASLHAGLLPIIRLTTKTNPLPLSMVLSLLLVAKHPGKTVRELAKMADISPNSASRLLNDLSDVNSFGGAGHGLIYRRVDDVDSRYMRAYLSEKGRALVRQIAGEMDRRSVRAAA